VKWHTDIIRTADFFLRGLGEGLRRDGERCSRLLLYQLVPGSRRGYLGNVRI